MNLLQALRELDGNNRARLFQKWIEYAPSRDVSWIDNWFDPHVFSDRSLRITYVMNHTQVCGGSKIILEHANNLTERGHHVSIVCHDPKPQWIEVKANYIQVPWQMSLVQAISVTDIIVCTVYDQVLACYLSKKAPVILFEQGDTYIFDFDRLPPEVRQWLRRCWSVPVPIIAVSQGLAKQIDHNFGRKPQILHNALDSRIFYPRKEGYRPAGRWKILLVGMEQTAFKGIHDIRKALAIIREMGYDFEAVWVTQIPPESPFDGTLVINPSQERLGEIYRSCDIYVSGSYYESFPLPPLEAMACGCAVVSTKNQGIEEYGIDGYNCLMAEKGNPESLASKIMYLMDNPDKTKELVQHGYETAGKYRWENIIPKLESYFYSAIKRWEEEKYHKKESTLKVVHLPIGLPRHEAHRLIDISLNTITEDWCLFLNEGEQIDESVINQLKKMLSEPVDSCFALQVLYPDDLPDHDIVRIENRIFRRGERRKEESHVGEPLPLRIIGQWSGYFLPGWLVITRQQYREGRYTELLRFLQQIFSTLEHSDRAVCAKWLVLVCFELGMYKQAAQVLRDAINVYPTYSDLYYLLSLLYWKDCKREQAKEFAKIAEKIGESLCYRETFAHVQILNSSRGIL